MLLEPSLPTCPCLSYSSPAHYSGRWTFGDGQQVLGQFKPPYNKSFQVPDPTVAQVLVEHNVTHTYTNAGEEHIHCPAGSADTPLFGMVPQNVSPLLD